MLGYWLPEKDIDCFAIEGKAEMAKHYQEYCACPKTLLATSIL
jgi:hypothetical protein